MRLFVNVSIFFLKCQLLNEVTSIKLLGLSVQITFKIMKILEDMHHGITINREFAKFKIYICTDVSEFFLFQKLRVCTGGPFLECHVLGLKIMFEKCTILKE